MMPRTAASLSRRLIVSLAAANAVILLLAAALYLWRGYGATESEMVDLLKERARAVAMAGHPFPESESAVFDSETGAAVPGSSPDLVAHLPRMIVHGLTDGVLTFITDDGPHFVAVAAAAQDGRIGAVMHRGPLSEGLLEWLMHEIQSDVLPIFVPLFVMTLAVTALTVGRAMAPVKTLSRQAGRMGPGSLDLRLTEKGVPAEVLPLVRAVNLGLDKVEAGFASQRRFTANAAHELRTPLAVLNARIEQVAEADLRKNLGADVERMARVVEQLLGVARLEAPGLEMAADLSLLLVAESVVADLYPLAVRVGKSLSLDDQGAPRLAAGNPDVLRDALRNLVENALRLSPPGETVEVVVGQGPAIRVLDRGPGVPDAEKSAIFEPFHRGKAKSGGSAGLGLNIAREAVRLHGGNIVVADRPGGGAEFSMIFGPCKADIS